MGVRAFLSLGLLFCSWVPSALAGGYGPPTKLTASDGAAGHRFGDAVAIEGDTVLVGAPNHDGVAGDSGRAYLFVGGAQVSVLAASEICGGDRFGTSVALGGGTVVVGAPGDDDVGACVGGGDGSPSGAVYVDGVRIGNPDFSGEGFGSSVAISAGRIAVGAPGSGGTAWVIEGGIATGLVNPSMIPFQSYGQSVALSGDLAAVSSAYIFVGTTVFRRSGASWLPEPFGGVRHRLSLSGSRLAYGHATSPTPPCAVWLRTGIATWANEPIVDLTSRGASVAIAGNRLVCGDSGDPIFETAEGEAFVFVRSGGTWIREAHLLAPDRQPFDRFGSWVAIDDEGNVVVGAPQDDDRGLDSGSAYAFERLCGNGVLDAGEECDDGNRLSGDGCTSECVVEFCGDGTVQPGIGEECEDGNAVSGDGCSADCQLEFCGDGVVQPNLGEECDDGNAVSGDGCSAACIVEFCGDGVVQPGIGEECEDGNAISGDGCTADCQLEFCGDGVLQPALGEICDLGPANGAASACCDAGCQLRTSTEICRPAAGSCDAPERCSGSDPQCPPVDALLPDGTPCADSNRCTVNSRCRNGQCAPRRTRNCDDGNPCTDDSCDSALGCIQTPNAASCDDADPCTSGDACSAGACGGTPLPDGDGDGVCDALDPCADALDADGDGIGDPCDNCTVSFNPDQANSDADAGGDVCDPCPLDPNNGCNFVLSAGITIGPVGGTVSTPLGGISVPPFALPRPTSIWTTEPLPQFSLDDVFRVATAAFGREKIGFGSPATITLKWEDANDDGFLDGFFLFPIRETKVAVWRNGERLAGPCGDPEFQAPLCTTACCDMDANRWTLRIRGLSEFALGAEEPQGLSGRQMLVKDKGGDASKRRLVMSSRDPAIAAPAKGGPGDPTLAGGQLLLANPVSGEADLHDLPAGLWKALGNPPGSRGYKYLDRTLASGPCKTVLVKPGKMLKAVCQGSQIDFSLDEASQGAVAVVLELGSDNAYCLSFGGTVQKDYGVVPGRTGLFKAADASPPLPCPLP